MSTTALILLIFFGLVAIWFGWRVFMTSSMVRSALSLLASMAAIGAMFLAMEAEFLGILQIMMMATEMSIMAIFMTMFMMDPGGMGGMDMSHQKIPSIGGGMIVGALVVCIAAFTAWGNMALEVPLPDKQNYDLGMELMKRSMMIFESAGTTILVAMIAAVSTALPYKSDIDGN